MTRASGTRASRGACKHCQRHISRSATHGSLVDANNDTRCLARPVAGTTAYYAHEIDRESPSDVVERHRKQWDAAAYDHGEIQAEYESSDYIDGWNDALDTVAAPLAAELERARTEIAVFKLAVAGSKR